MKNLTNIFNSIGHFLVTLKEYFSFNYVYEYLILNLEVQRQPEAIPIPSDRSNNLV